MTIKRCNQGLFFIIPLCTIALLQGKIQKGAMVTVMRGKRMVHEGKLASLRRVKDNVNEVREVARRGGERECGGNHQLSAWCMRASWRPLLWRRRGACEGGR